MPDSPDSDATREMLEFVIKLKLDEMKRGLAATEQELKTFDTKAKSSLASTSKAIDDFDKKGKALGSGWTTTLKAMESSAASLAAGAGVSFATLAGAIGIAAKAYGDLQAQANTLQAVSGASGAEMDSLNAKAIALGESSKFTAKQVHEANTELARLGFTSAEITDAIDGVVAAAAASGESLAMAGELVAGTVRGFGLTADKASYVADVLAKSANISALSFGDLQNSLKYVAPVASSANQSLEDMAAILAVLSNNMIRGEQGGTATRSMIVSLLNPSKEAKEHLDRLGVTMEDVTTGKLKPLKQIFAELAVAMRDYKGVAQGKMLGDIFGTEAISAATVLMKTASTQLIDMREQLNSVSGEAQKTADIMQRGLNYELDQLKAKAETAAVKFGEKLAPALEEAVKFLQQLLDIVSGMPEPMKAATTQVGLLALAVTGLSLAFGGAVLGGGKLLLLAKEIAEKVPLLAPFLTGGALMGAAGAGTLLVGGASAIMLQTAAMNLDTETQEKELLQGSPNEALARLNKLLGKGDKGKDLSKLSKDELRQGQVDAQQAQTYYKNQITSLDSAVDELARLEEEFSAKWANGSGIWDATLNGRIEALRDGMGKRAADLRQAKGELERYEELEQRFQETISKAAPKQGGGTGTKGVPDPDAQREADKARVKRVQDLIDSQERATQRLKQELEQQGAALTTAAGGYDRLAEAAKNWAKVGPGGFSEADRFAKKDAEGLFAIGVACDYATQEMLRLGGVSEQVLAKFTNRVPDTIRNLEKAGMVTRVSAKDARAGDITTAADLSHIGLYVGNGEIVDAGNSVGYQIGKGQRVTQRDQWMSNARYYRINSAYMGAGGNTELQKNAQSQQALNQLTALYNQQLQDAIALRDQMPKGGDAWKKADEQVFALQQAMGQSGLDAMKLQADLRKAQADAARAWAREELSIEAGMLEAKAQMTEDGLDDIGAAWRRHLAEIRSEELERLAQEGLTEEQKTKLKKLYDQQRLAADKQYNDQVRNYNKERVDYVRQLERDAEDSRVRMMEDGLEKSIAILELEKKRKLEALEEETERERKRWESSPEAKQGRREAGDHGGAAMGMRPRVALQSWEQSAAAQGLQAKGDAINAETQYLIDELKRLDANRRAIEQITDKFKDVDLGQRESQQGVHDPQRLEAIQTQALKERMGIEKERTAELERQRKAVTDGTTEARDLDRQIADSKRQQRQFELDMTDIVINRLEREQASRREQLGLVTQVFSRILGTSNQIGQSVVQWVDAIQRGLSQMFDENGKPLDLLGMMGIKFYGEPVNPDDDITKAQGKTAGLADGAATGIGAILGGPIGAAVAPILADTVFSLGGALWDTFAGLTAEKWEDINAQRAAQDRDLSIRLLQQRIEFEQQAGHETLGLEKQLLQLQKEQALQALEDEERQLRNKKTGILGQQTTEEKAMLDQFLSLKSKRQLEIHQRTLDQELVLEREKNERAKEAARQLAEDIAALKLSIAEKDAAATPSQADDIEARKQAQLDRNRQAANDALRKNPELMKRLADGENTRDPLAALSAWAEMQFKIYQDPEYWNKHLATASPGLKAELEGKYDFTGGQQKENYRLIELLSHADIDLGLSNKATQAEAARAAANEELRIVQLVSEVKQRGFQLSKKGLEGELALIREKAAVEKASLEAKLKDPTLDPRERAALSERRRLLADETAELERQAKLRDENARRLAPFELALEQARATDTGTDDATAAYRKQLEELRQAEEKAREDITGPRLQTQLAIYAQQRLNAERNLQQQLKQLWQQETTDKLEQQKTLISESLTLATRENEDHIREAQAKLRDLGDELKKYQRDLEAKEREREAEKKKVNPNDGVRNTAFGAELAALNITPYAEAGVDAIANTNTHKTLPTVSKRTVREGLLKEADLQQLEATNQFNREDLTEQQYAEKMKFVALLRIKAAEEELKTEGLKREKKLELEREWAEGYAAWQEWATKALDARYDAEAVKIQENIDKKNLEMQTQQDRIDDWQKAIDDLRATAEDKLRLIDDEILKVTQKTRDWAPAWNDVEQGIKQAHAASEKLWKDMSAGIKASKQEMEALIATSASLPGATGSGAAPSVSDLAWGRSKTKDQTFTKNGVTGTYSVAGDGGWYYYTSSDAILGTKIDKAKTSSSSKKRSSSSNNGGSGWADQPGNKVDKNGNTSTTNPAYLAEGAFIPDNPRYSNDGYGPVYLNRREAVVPFDRWPEILRPWTQPASMTRVSGPTEINVPIYGNQFYGETDIDRTVRSAVGAALREQHENLARQGGPNL